MSWANVAGAAVGVVGGYMANKGSKQSGQVTTTGSQVTDVPEWQKPYIQALMNQAQSRQGQLGSGTPLLGPAQDEYMKTIQGGYLSPEANPYLRQTFDQAAQGVTDAYQNVVQPRTASAFFGPGSLQGNSAYAGTVGQQQIGLGRSLSDLATNIYGGNYQQERQRQFGAAGAAPGFTQQTYGAAFSPFSSYLDVIGRPFGTSGASSQSQPYFTNPAAGMIGGGLLGAQIGSQYRQPNTPTGQPYDYGWLSQGSSTPYAGGYGFGNV